ncbi:MAG TPA: hypothetical protein VHW03_04565 [Chthoniobacterales bacterium]|jgi:hypothetical protein|nr:hypothetical protein [Chthoniobacterales bacterium]
MDIVYIVKQLDREILLEQTRLAEKQASREKLFNALSAQEQAVVTDAAEQLKAPANPPAAAPPA